MKSLNVFLVAVVFAAQTFGASSLFAGNDAQAQLEMIAAKKAELNNHEWEVKLTSSAGKGNPVSDTLVFTQQMFESKAMTSKGYKPTNYTVSLQEGGPTVWETMQSTDSGNPVFWRGEWEGDSMRGVMSKQVGEGKNEDYYFSSVSSKAIEPPPAPVVPEPVKEEAAAVQAEVKDAAADVNAAAEATLAEAQKEAAAAPAVVQEEQPKKKKKGWF